METITIDRSAALDAKVSTNMALIITFGVIVVIMLVFIIVWIVVKRPDGSRLFGCCGVTQKPTEATFDVNVATKTTQHPWYGQGSMLGYVVNGEQGRTVNLKANKSYVFTNHGSCDHPFYISTSDVGAGQGEVTEGVSSEDILRVCDGSSLTFIPTSSQVGQQLYYQCRVHEKMGGPIHVSAQ